jgi:hypothetical protein
MQLAALKLKSLDQTRFPSQACFFKKPQLIKVQSLLKKNYEMLPDNVPMARPARARIPQAEFAAKF